MRFVSKIKQPAYRDDPYWVLVSIVNEVNPDRVETAKTRIAKIDFGGGMKVDEIDLMGRDGVAWGGVWKHLERFSLGSG